MLFRTFCLKFKLVVTLLATLSNCEDLGGCPDICGRGAGLPENPEGEQTFKPNGKGLENRIALEGQDSKEDGKTKEEEEVNYIVNGYTADLRPFLVKLVFEMKGQSKIECGGSILNKKFIITAAHCSCFQMAHCNATTSKTNYPMENVHVYAGINTQSVKNLETNYKHSGIQKPKVKQLFIHPSWFDREKNTDPYAPYIDLCLIELVDELKFTIDAPLLRIAPICLGKKSPIKVDRSKAVAFVAGWGKTWLKDDDNNDCLTDGSGPAKWKICFPRFTLFKERESGGEGKKRPTCLKNTKTPSEVSLPCRVLKQQGLLPKFSTLGDHAIIKAKAGNESAKPFKNKTYACYPKPPELHGWCGTCNKSNGCEKMDEIDVQIGSNQDWGFCANDCTDSVANKPDTLQEARMDFLTEEECESLAISINKDHEFCLGRKLPFPKAIHYTWVHYCAGKCNVKKVLEGEGSFEFIKEKEIVDKSFIKEEHRKYDFYVGETDSCQGDSGGPLFVFRKNITYLVGVVSRGKKCSLLNNAGIYTNVSAPEVSDWITTHIKSGNC